jgi:hypothetical protein
MLNFECSESIEFFEKLQLSFGLARATPLPRDLLTRLIIANVNI